MILPLIDKKIRRAFSNSALQYEALASMQKEIGRELIAKLMSKEEYSRILDVGMGPGWSTNRLDNLFPEAYVVGLDFASGMIKTAKQKYEQINVVQADASFLPFKKDMFDVVTSNLSYQWVIDLNRAFLSAHSVLKRDGIFCFTMFGYDTLKELFSSMEECSNEQNRQSPMKRMAAQGDVRNALTKAGFTNIAIKSEYIKTHFPDMMALIKWLKEIGANVNVKDMYIGKELLKKASDFYNKNFSDRLGIYATFEVIWVEAQKQ